MWKSKRRRQAEAAAAAEAARIAAEEQRREKRSEANRTIWLAAIGTVVSGIVVAAITGGFQKAWEALFAGDPVEVNGGRAAAESYPYWTSDNPGFTVLPDRDRHNPHCSVVSVVPSSEVAPPEFDEHNQLAKISEWVRRNQAADPDDTEYAFTVTAKDKAVTIQAARAVYVRRGDRPASARLVQLHVGKGCGAGGTLQEFTLDLDDPNGPFVPSAGTAGFPYTLDKEKSVNFRAVASTVNCDCVWYIELKWISGDEKGTTCVMDGSFTCPENVKNADRAFHTAPSAGYPPVAWTLSGPDKTSPPWVGATFDWVPPARPGR